LESRDETGADGALGLLLTESATEELPEAPEAAEPAESSEATECPATATGRGTSCSLVTNRAGRFWHVSALDSTGEDRVGVLEAESAIAAALLSTGCGLTTGLLSPRGTAADQQDCGSESCGLAEKAKRL
jgi:hypothetical protein